MIDDVIIIGIDSGYGNIKTANCCFPASLSAYDREPVFKENLLVFEGKFYLIGEGHKEFLADKTKDTPDVELDPIVVGSHAKPQRANNSNTNKRHKHIEDAPQKGQIARRRDVGAARLYDFLSVLILVAFSITAFAMNGFVKEHAPETYLGVFLVCFIANSTVLLPAPSILVVLQYSMILNPVVVVICGALGASLGEMVGFMTGVHSRHFVSGKLIRKIEDHFPSHPYIFVLVFSALPLPLFDVVGMMAGAIRLNKFKFYLICLAGKLFNIQHVLYNYHTGNDKQDLTVKNGARTLWKAFI